MILYGRVNSFDEPHLTITLVIKGKKYLKKAIIDTGFNGYLSVPLELAKNWYFFGYEEYEIATGDIVAQQVYLGQIFWNEKIRDIYVVTSKSQDVLIGTKLLKRSKLVVNFPSKKLTVQEKKNA